MYAGEASPPISIVIAAWAGEEALSNCLRSLAPQSEGAEIVVAANYPVAAIAADWEGSGELRVLEEAPSSTVFRLRALGAAHAQGRLVALIEDHVTAGPRWVDALVEEHGSGYGIMGGPVENGRTDRAYDWALFFCEYGFHMPPVPGGPVKSLSGVNVAYDRELLVSCVSTWRETFQENEVNDALRAAGHSLRMVPNAVVRTHLPMELPQAMAHLFEGGRHFGRYRAFRASLPRRVLWVVASAAIPFVLGGRIIRRVAERDPRRLWHVARSTGYLALVLGAWTVGEALGYVDSVCAGRGTNGGRK